MIYISLGQASFFLKQQTITKKSAITLLLQNQLVTQVGSPLRQLSNEANSIQFGQEMEISNMSKRTALRWYRCTRPISIYKQHVQPNLLNGEPDGCHKLWSSDLVDDTCQFQPLESPATLASVTMAPSIPLYIRRGCIISLRADKNTLHLSSEWQNLWFNLFCYGRFSTSLYHKLLSTSTFNGLIAPNFGSGSVKTLHSLKLDGTRDWNIWGKDSIVAYEGNSSLEVRSAFWRLLRDKVTYSRKFKVLRGRGNVLLSGSGSVYTVELTNANDEILIRPQNILGIDGTSQLDIQHSVVKATLKPLAKDNTIRTTTDVEREFDIKMFFEISRDIAVHIWNFLARCYNYFVNDNQTKFLKIKGPRTLLIQTGKDGTLWSKYNYVKTKRLTNSAPIENTPPSKSPKNYLNIVTIDKAGNVNFKSTSDFSETVNLFRSKR